MVATVIAGRRLWSYAPSCYIPEFVRICRTNGEDKMAIEDALMKLLRDHREGMEAEALRVEMQKLGFSEEETRRAIGNALNRGRVQLGRELRLELEAA
jgi:hypothetical protein